MWYCGRKLLFDKPPLPRIIVPGTRNRFEVAISKVVGFPAISGRKTCRNLVQSLHEARHPDILVAYRICHKYHTCLQYLQSFTGCVTYRLESCILEGSKGVVEQRPRIFLIYQQQLWLHPREYWVA